MLKNQHLLKFCCRGILVSADNFSKSPSSGSIPDASPLPYSVLDENQKLSLKASPHLQMICDKTLGCYTFTYCLDSTNYSCISQLDECWAICCCNGTWMQNMTWILSLNCLLREGNNHSIAIGKYAGYVFCLVSCVHLQHKCTIRCVILKYALLLHFIVLSCPIVLYSASMHCEAWTAVTCWIYLLKSWK